MPPFRIDIRHKFVDDIIATTNEYQLVVRQDGTEQQCLIPGSFLLALPFFLLLAASRGEQTAFFGFRESDILK